MPGQLIRLNDKCETAFIYICMYVSDKKRKSKKKKGFNYQPPD